MKSVQTVTGSVLASDLGVVMPHEHVWQNLYKSTRNLIEVLDDPENSVAELMNYRELGGKTIVDCTTVDLDRRPSMIRDISEKSGVNIVMGCGWYREPTYPADLDRRSVSSLYDELIQDIEVGINGIRPGVIGEIGADKEWVSGIEERVLRAAGRAQVKSGLGIVLHAVKSRVGLQQLDILAEEGVDLSRVAVGHCDSFPELDYHREIADRGAFVLYDRNGPGNKLKQAQRVKNLAILVKEGYGSQLLISHDVCISSDREGNGGAGYSYILRQTYVDLIEAGVEETVVRGMISDNPIRLLAGAEDA